MLKTNFLNLMKNYLPNRLLNVSQRTELRHYLNNEIKPELEMMVKDKNLRVSINTGVGRPADIVWIGLHSNNKSVDSSAQTGVYMCILFKVLGEGLALSIQHGTDKLGSSESIRESVVPISKAIFKSSFEFSIKPLSLRPLPLENKVFKNDNRTSRQIFNNTSRPARYEIANILGKVYSLEEIEESNLEEDLMNLLNSYINWINNILDMDKEDDYQKIEIGNINEFFPDINDDTPPVRSDSKHLRVGSLHPPRNKKEGLIAIRKADFCCEFNKSHTTFLTDSGFQFMEKHHLIPMEKYFDFPFSIDHHTNIYSLCPNCHRMIHLGKESNKREMIKALYDKRLDLYKLNFKVDLMDIYKLYNL